MNTYITIFLLGLSLSMDAFSLAIFIGTIITRKNAKKLIILVGLFHLILPILGSLVGYKVSNIISVNENLLFGLILLFLSLQIIIGIIKNKEEEYKFSTFELICLAFGVSLDSFTIGFGMIFHNSNILLASTTFSLLSMLFTTAGLIIGKYSKQILGSYAKVIGAIFLLLLGLTYLIP